MKHCDFQKNFACTQHSQTNPYLRKGLTIETHNTTICNFGSENHTRNATYCCQQLSPYENLLKIYALCDSMSIQLTKKLFGSNYEILKYRDFLKSP